jgi:XTP/dITP diphosphohydrolase
VGSLPWVIATRSAGKLRELRALFAAHDIELASLDEVGIAVNADAEEGIEAFDSFEKNALAKARCFSRMLPGRVVVSDDSGLVVDALAGAPGVRSKRWSGRSDLDGAALDAANNALLVASAAPLTNRMGRFVCVAVAIRDGVEIVRRGALEGQILMEPRGSSGFGYDPHFFVSELGKTLAEATLLEKERVSHRGHAFRALLKAMSAGVGGS